MSKSTHKRIESRKENESTKSPESSESPETNVPTDLDWRLLWRTIGYMKPYARKRNALTVISVMRAVQIPSLAWLIGWTLSGPINQRDWSGTLWGAGACMALGVFTMITFHFRMRWGMELGESVVHDLRRDIFAKLQRLPMTFYDRTRLGRIISRVTSDAENMRQGVQEVLYVTLIQAGQMVVAAVFMAVYDPVLFGVVLLISPVLFGISRYFRPRISAAWREVQESFSRVTSTIAEAVNGIRVTQAFERQERNAEHFGTLVKAHGEKNLRAARLQATFIPLIELNNQMFLALLLIVGGYQVLVVEGSILPGFERTPGEQFEAMVVFFFMASIFFGGLNFIARVYNLALSAMAGAERVFQLLDEPEPNPDAPDAQPIGRIEGHVVLEDVVFGYDAQKPVLHGIRLEALPGQTLALVGHTGSGKSTIIKLLTKFYAPQSGHVLIDGQRLTDVTTDSLVKQVGVVTQQNFLFTGTVADNIRLGRLDATDEDVMDAARRLDCMDLLDRLPDGLHTPVGERGTSLSLGQRQLVCFCRAMLADPRILILDEATSSVDTITEVRIQRSLERLLEGRTSFVVAHRLSTVRDADQVIVLDHGRIIERGRHHDLLAARGAYADLYRQFVQTAEA